MRIALIAGWLGCLPLVFMASFIARADDIPAELMPQSPIGTFETVEGTAWVISDCTKYPAATVGAIFAGDTVVVDLGRVTVFDIRSGQRYLLGAPTTFPMPQSEALPRPGLVEHLRGLRKLLHTPLSCIAGVRGDIEPPCWPKEGDVFALTSPIIFDWGLPNTYAETPVWLFRRSARQVAITSSARDTVIVTLTEQDTPGVKLWPADPSRRAGASTWSLQDASGRAICGGTFEILSRSATDSARAYYSERASQEFPDSLQAVGAILLAAKDHHFLW